MDAKELAREWLARIDAGDDPAAVLAEAVSLVYLLGVEAGMLRAMAASIGCRN